MGRLCFFKWYFEKKWVGRAMGNEKIYWDGLTLLYKYMYIDIFF